MRVRSGFSELEPRGRMKFVESLRVREHAAGHSANQRIEEHVNNLAGWPRDCGAAFLGFIASPFLPTRFGFWNWGLGLRAKDRGEGLGFRA